MESQTSERMDAKNRLQAFILMPVCMMLVSGIIYFIIVFGQVKSQSILAIVASPLILCWAFIPMFNKCGYKEMYYNDSDMPIKDKIKKHKPTLAGYGVITIGIAILALFMH